MKDIDQGNLVDESKPLERFDEFAFENDMNTLIDQTKKAYTNMLYADAVRFGFYELTKEKDRYIHSCNLTKSKLHSKLIKKYIECQVLIMSPIIPHFCDYIWTECMKKSSSILKAKWP